MVFQSRVLWVEARPPAVNEDIREASLPMKARHMIDPLWSKPITGARATIKAKSYRLVDPIDFSTRKSHLLRSTAGGEEALPRCFTAQDAAAARLVTTNNVDAPAWRDDQAALHRCIALSAACGSSLMRYTVCRERPTSRAMFVTATPCSRRERTVANSAAVNEGFLPL
jgi:hypothetical protein